MNEQKTLNYYDAGGAYEEEFVLSKEEIKKCRHKSEQRWYRGLCVINGLILLLAVVIIAVYTPLYYQSFCNEVNEMTQEMIADLKASTNEDSGKNEKKAEKSNQGEKKKKKESKKEKEEEEELTTEETDIYMYAIMAIVALFILPFMLNLYYQQYRTMSIRITPKNFPEIYDRVELYAKRLGMKKVPEVYIIQQNGILNAFSSFIVRKQYIEIYADIFEIAYREHKDLDAISFILAHEMAHIKYKHATFAYQMKIMYASIIPILGSTASRAREYSCDRLAQKVTGVDGMDAMFSLMAGKHLYKMVDKEDYLEYAQGVKGFFVWCANLVADHPVMTKRIQALAMREGSGKLY